MHRGLWYAAGAYLCWGLLPIFWKALHNVPALEILAHRVAWAVIVALALIAATRQWAPLSQALRSRRTVLTYGLSALLLSANWFIYIWAVNDGHIVETSLGYFINPLVNVLLGMLFLKERLRLGQGLAIAIACAGVLYLTFSYGSLPWIALMLAGSFGVYGLIRKTAALDSLTGLTLETLLMAPLALIYLASLGAAGTAAFPAAGLSTSLLLAASGVITAVPLLLFAAGARRITMTSLGLLQYIAPSMQFTLGVTLYGEPLSTERLIGFCIIWVALIIYTVESLTRGRVVQRQAAAGKA